MFLINFLYEKWIKLTILSKAILLVAYVAFSFPMFTSIENFSSSIILSSWYLLSLLLNIVLITLFFVWLEKINFNILPLLLIVGLYIKEPSLGFLRILLFLNITRTISYIASYYRNRNS